MNITLSTSQDRPATAFFSGATLVTQVGLEISPSLIVSLPTGDLPCRVSIELNNANKALIKNGLNTPFGEVEDKVTFTAYEQNNQLGLYIMQEVDSGFLRITTNKGRAENFPVSSFYSSGAKRLPREKKQTAEPKAPNWQEFTDKLTPEELIDIGAILLLYLKNH